MNTTHSLAHSMEQANALFAIDKATHVAVRDGNWTDPNTWEGGKVPTDEAIIHIPEGISIRYDARTSPDLGMLRVDGNVKFARDHSTEMRIETIVTTPGSSFDIGSMGDPIPASVTVDIVFRDTPIDTAADPEMLGHGLVAFGDVDIQGAAKQGHLVIKGDVPAGATSMAVEGDLNNWKAGDTILVVGTTYLGENSKGVLMTEDETRTITRVEGDTIHFDTPLDHGHSRPTSQEADIYVGNLSRNVTFSSENPEGTRGHVMMGNGMADAVDGSANNVRYAAFEDLGRTDKTMDISAANPEGRYPLHLHQTGTDEGAATNYLVGNAVSGSPGWGIVQHSSRGEVNDNIVYDIVGGGIVSELGNETGAWMRNLVSSVTGYNAENKNGDGDQGAAYENQSRIIVQQDNIAANSKLGWNFSGQESFAEDDSSKAPNDGIHRKMFERDQLKFDPDPFDVAIDHEEPAITDFVGNEVMTSTEAFRVFHRQFANHSDTLSVIRDFDIWGGKDGVNLQNYAFNYEFIDSDWSGSGIAFTMWGKNSSAVMNDIRASDFGLLWKAHGISHEAVLYDVVTNDVDRMFDIAYDNTRGDTSYWKQYFAQFGIDYENPLPKILSKEDADPNAGLTFTLGSDADNTLAPNDDEVHITGKIVDGLGERVFYENIIGSTSNQASSYEGASLKLVNYDTTWHRNFSRDEFLELHGTWQKENGDWVAPVVFWLTERLSGDQHPVVIEINLKDFDDTYLSKFALASYPTPEVNNPDFELGFDVTGGGTHLEGETGVTMPPVSGGSETDTPVAVTTEPEAVPTETGGETLTGSDGELGEGDAPIGEIPAPMTPGRPETIDSETGVTTMPIDPISGGAGDPGSMNLVEGTARDERMDGTADGDILFAGLGSDILRGKAGADIFALSVGDAGSGKVDDVKDFDLLEGDMVALVDVPGALASSGAFDWVRFVKSGTLGELQIDTGTGFELLAKFRWGRDLDVEDLYASGQFKVFESIDALIAGDETPVDQGGKTPVETPTEPKPVVETPAEPTPVEPQDPAGEAEDVVSKGGSVEGDTPVELPVEVEPVGETATASEFIFELTHAGSDTNDYLTGSEGDDVLVGYAGTDRIWGGNGNDILIGDQGSDKLFGGSGADTFVLKAWDVGQGVDDIKDFDASEGDILAIIGAADDVPEDMLARMRIVDKGTVGVLQYDQSGEGFKDMAMLRNGRGLDIDTLYANGALELYS